ncbi:MAG TPA: hypothetical protein VEG68_11530 [Terriglobales bacterium]|nr:hypothetical protein [Terriglobales bacterium]
MHYVRVAFGVAAFLLLTAALVAQQSSAPSAPSSDDTAASKNTTVQGCLRGERGNYILIEDKTGSIYVLKGVGNKLDNYLRHEVEVKGRILSGTVKTGVRPEKAGSNPADTVHGVDGVPFQVGNVQTDVRTVAKSCKAADQQ